MSFGELDSGNLDTGDLGGYRAPAKYPVLPPLEAESMRHRLAQGALSGLGYVGSSLDKLFGGRAVRAGIDTLAGSHAHARDILSAIPFSDTLGITNPEQAVSGAQLLKNTTGYDPERKGANWAERNLVGPITEGLLDPSMYLGGIGALTHLGEAATKGTAQTIGREVPNILQHGYLDALRSGQRTLMHGWTGPSAAAAVEGTRGLLGAGNDVLRKIPGVAGLQDASGKAITDDIIPVLRAGFSAKHGFVPQKDIQAASAGVGQDAYRELESHFRRENFDVGTGLQRGAQESGLTLDQAKRYVTQQIETGKSEVPLGGSLKEIADRIRSGGEAQRGMEVAEGVKSPQMQDTLGYLMRQKSPYKGPKETDFLNRKRFMQTTTGSAGKQRLEALQGIPGGTVAINDLIDQLGGMEAPAIEAGISHLGLEPEKMGKFRDFLGSIDREKLQPGGFFDIDPTRMYTQRAELGAKAITGGKVARETLAKTAREGISSETHLTIPEVLAKTGLDPEKSGQLVAESMGIHPDQLKSLVVPKEVAEGLTKLLERGQNPQEVNAFLQKARILLGYTKRGLYTIWPGSHSRNMLSGGYQNFMDTGTHPFGSAHNVAINALTGADRGAATGIAHLPTVDDLMREAYAQRVIGEKAGELAGEKELPKYGGNPGALRSTFPQIAQQAKQDFMRPGWRNPIGEEGTAVKTGQALNSFVEDRLRLTQFTDLMQKGWNARNAADQVFKTHFDYERGLAPFEKKLYSNTMTFPTYSRFNIPKQVGDALTNPRKIEPIIRFSGSADQNQQGNYVPHYLQGGLALPIPATGLPEGTVRYMTRMGLPFEEALGHLKTGPNAVSTAQQTGQDFLSFMRPDAKAALEWLTNTQLHTGRKLSDLDAGRLGALTDYLGEDATTLIQQIISGSPLSRIKSTTEGLIDPRKATASGALINALKLAGLGRYSDVDTEKWRAIDEANQEKEEMGRSRNIRANTDYYIPKNRQENASDEDVRKMREWATIKAQQKAEQKRRQQMGS